MHPPITQLDFARKVWYDRPFIVDSTKFQSAFDVAPTDFDTAVEVTVSAWR